VASPPINALLASQTWDWLPATIELEAWKTKLYVGQQKILFDREATVALYRQTIMVPGADQCSCISCKNFAAQRGTIFAETFLQFLNELGADPLKEWEAFDYDFDPKNPRKRVLYGGWFLFVGELVEGFDKRPEPAQQGFAHWFTTSFPAGTLPTGLKLCAVEFLQGFRPCADESVTMLHRVGNAEWSFR
jgi:hypothetical protein